MKHNVDSFLHNIELLISIGLAFCLFLAKPVKFEPEPEEAKASRSIGVIIMMCLGFVCAPIVISDLPTIIRMLKGKRTPNAGLRRGYSRYNKRFTQ